MDYATRQFRYDKLLAAFLPNEVILPPLPSEKPKRYRRPSASPRSPFSSRVYPNGECSIGYVPPTRKRAEDSRQDRGEICGGTIVESPRTHELDNGACYTDTTDMIQYLRPKLGIPHESSQTPKKYGLKGITAYGRKMLRNAGHCLDVAVKGELGQLPQMGTLTIPSLEPERMRLICIRWSDIVRRFFQECKRRYVKLGLRFHYACCSEVQPERWESRREVGLHLHFLFVACRISKSDWSLPDQWVRDTWRRVLCTYVGEENVPNQLNYRRETVQRSSAAYLAKYASKGAEFIKEVAETAGAECLPSQWWSISADLRECIKSHTQTSASTQAELLWYICKHEMMEYLRYVRIATIICTHENGATGAIEEMERVVGYGGLLTAEGKKLFQPPDMNACIKRFLRVTVDKSG